MKIPVLLLLIFVSSISVSSANETPTVVVNDIPKPVIEEFDHTKPPGDLKPEEDGDARLGVTVTPPKWGGTFDGTTITITKLETTSVDGHIRIRIPDDADKDLKDHENGHADLYVNEYKRAAKKKTEDAYRGLKGMKFIGKGDTADKRQADAKKQIEAELKKRGNRALNGILDQANTLKQKYDDLTDHGVSPKVNTEQGKKMAIAERDKAIKAAKAKRSPAKKKPVAGTQDPPLVLFDEATQKLIFDIQDPIDFINTGLPDPLLGAEIRIDPVQVIGLDEMGRMHLGSSQMWVTAGGQDVLHGYLWEMAYMESSLPGYGGMIQGYLDIPPEFTNEGIVNDVLMSPFLSELQNFVDLEPSGFVPSFWFFTDQMMFDTSGTLLASTSSGELKFGQHIQWRIEIWCRHTGTTWHCDIAYWWLDTVGDDWFEEAGPLMA